MQGFSHSIRQDNLLGTYICVPCMIGRLVSPYEYRVPEGGWYVLHMRTVHERWSGTSICVPCMRGGLVRPYEHLRLNELMVSSDGASLRSVNNMLNHSSSNHCQLCFEYNHAIQLHCNNNKEL